MSELTERAKAAYKELNDPLNMWDDEIAELGLACRDMLPDLIAEVDQLEAKLAEIDSMDWKGIVDKHLEHRKLVVGTGDRGVVSIAYNGDAYVVYTLIHGWEYDYTLLEDAITAALALCEKG